MGHIPFSIGLAAAPFAGDDQEQAAQFLLRRLPAMPSISARLLGMMGRADVSLKEISDLIVSDAALACKILLMSNSAMFGARSEVRSILHALAVLGTEKVKGMACTVALGSYLGNALQIPALRRCWRHNLATAIVCAEIAIWAQEDTGEAYTMGILHDVGRLGLIAMDPGQYLQILDRLAARGGELRAFERQQYGLDHTEAGEWFATAWGLPRMIVQSIQGHHERPAAGRKGPEVLLYYGCQISDYLGFSATDSTEAVEDPVEEFLTLLGAARKERLGIRVDELQILIASRVNALEA